MTAMCLGAAVRRPDLAPVVVSITTGRPDSIDASVVRERVIRYTSRSAWWSVRAKDQDPGRVAARRRTKRRNAAASA